MRSCFTAVLNAWLEVTVISAYSLAPFSMFNERVCLCVFACMRVIWMPGGSIIDNMTVLYKVHVTECTAGHQTNLLLFVK